MNIFTNEPGVRVCAVFAHPDDTELLCYGTLAKFKKARFDISIIIATGGKHGVAVAEERIENLEEIRLSETKEALKEITDDVRVLDLHDGAIQFNGESVSVIEKIFNNLAPAVVITHFTDQTGIDHQDHQAVSRIVKNICFRKSYVRYLLVAEPLKSRTGFNPNLFIWVGEFFNQKMAALASHRSQEGRIYLSDIFHKNRSLVWQNLLGTASDDDHIESFMLEKAVL